MPISPEVVSEFIAEQTVLLDLRSGKYYRLNPAGTLVWRSLEKGVATDVICEAIAAAYDQPRESVYGDVLKLLADLTDKGLIEAA